MGKELFEKNLKAIEKYQPELAKHMRGLENAASQLVEQSGQYNIDLGHISFYDAGAEDFTSKQFEIYLKKPLRVQSGWPGPLAENIWKAQTFRTELRDYYADKGITAAPDKLDSSAAFAVVLGLGLGYHIDKIFSSYDVRSIYIAEQFPEFVYHALHVQDAGKWYEEAEKRKGRFYIILDDDPNQMVNVIFAQVKFKEFGLTDGAYYYEHYDSFFLKKVAELFLERLPVFSANPGFFEDELVMMTNCFKNITGNKFWDFSDQIRFSNHTPVFIAGSGPSLDGSIDLLDRFRDQIVLISAGTGLGTILAYGLKPDFHVEMENTPGPPRLIGELADSYDLSDIVLIAPNTVHPDVPPFFDKSILFFRDAVSSTKFFGVNSQEIYYASPVVTNAATRIALGMGFKNIYLAGIDLGSRVQDTHHSKKSVYYKDGFMAANPAHQKASKFGLKTSGNLGGQVYTNTSFLNASMFFSSFKSVFPLASLYNLSDGVRILGAIPKLPETVTDLPEATSKQRELRHIFDLHDSKADFIKVNRDDLQDLQDGMVCYYDALYAAALATDEKNPDIFSFYDAIHPIVYADGTTHIDRTIHQFNVGTVLMYYQTAFQMIRRLKKEDRPAFFALFKEKFLRYVKDMERQFLDFIEDMKQQVQ